MGCTTSLGRSNSRTSAAPTLVDRHDDRRQRAIDELDRNHIEWRDPIEGERFRFVSDFLQPEGMAICSAALNVRQIVGEDDFVSASNAQPMSRADVRNVELVAAIEAKEMLHAIARRLGLEVVESDPRSAETEWGGWKNGDERWTLSPHQLRKLRPKKRHRS